MKRPPEVSRSVSLRSVHCGLWVALVALVVVALFCGHVTILPDDLWQMVLAFTQDLPLSDDLQIKQTIMLQLRLPRMVLAVFAGAGMACAGVVFQAALRNVLVSPEILGVSAGCSLGALLALLSGLTASLVWIAPSALAGGMIAVVFCLLVSRHLKGDSTLNMILIGLVLTSLLNALVLLLKFALDPYQKLPSVLFWLLGSLNHAGWFEAGIIAVASGLACFAMLKVRFRLNLISLGDLESHALGFASRRVRYWLLLAASGIVAVIVAGCGQIGWIALVVPHAARAWAGPDHLKMAPLAVLLGAVTLLGADVASYAFTQVELPISVVTSLIGAPLFVWLLFRQRGSGWE